MAVMAHLWHPGYNQSIKVTRLLFHRRSIPTMRTQIPVLLVAIVVLFICGSIAVQRAIQIGPSVENRHAALIGVYTNASQDNLSAISDFVKKTGDV
jgi:hypothetical protein